MSTYVGYVYFYEPRSTFARSAERIDTGQIVQRYEYSSFGKILRVQDGVGTDTTTAPRLKYRYTYTGRELDEEIGLYYYRARHYDASTGRFLQTDPHPGSIRIPLSVTNSYTYVANAPTKFVDPNGKYWFIVIGAIVGAFVGIVENNQKGGNWLEQVGRGAIAGAMYGFAFSVNPVAAGVSLGLHVGTAASKDGNFFENLNRNSIELAAMAIVTSYIGAEFESLSSVPGLGGSFATIQNLGTAIGFSIQLQGFLTSACEKESGSWKGSDICEGF